MPKNTNILMIRHAEKPASGPALSVAGGERAAAYAVYFQNYEIHQTVIKLDYLFAAASSTESNRPSLTLEPLAAAIGLPINSSTKDKDYSSLAPELLTNPIYDNSNILICWHHGKILDFAKALGADGAKLPKKSKFPVKPWNPAVFGWVLHLCYKSDGTLDPEKTKCHNEKLMFDDYGKNPPVVKKKSKSSSAIE